MHLVDAVGRQGLALAALVLTPALFEFQVVGADAGCGELVDPDAAQVGGDVVADDLPIPLDRGIGQPQLRHPMLGIHADRGGLSLELLARCQARLACNARSTPAWED